MPYSSGIYGFDVLFYFTGRGSLPTGRLNQVTLILTEGDPYTLRRSLCSKYGQPIREVTEGGYHCEWNTEQEVIYLTQYYDRWDVRYLPNGASSIDTKGL